MPDTTDSDLIRQFVRDHSEVAFAELVRRYIDLVYSVARRCTNHATDAEDVTQIVFHIFARKAPEFKAATVLGGWFYTTTRFAAARFLRGKMRREAREKEFTMMQETLGDHGHDSDATWRQLFPHLEKTMSRLGERDRTLLVLRYFENKTGAQTASLLGIQESAIHKRTARALEKLRNFFAQHGITLTSTALATALSTNAVQAAPNYWIAPIAAAATGVTMTPVISGVVLETLRAMAWAKAKWTLTLGSAAVATGIIGIAITTFEGSTPPTNPALARQILQAAFDRVSSPIPAHLRITAEVQVVNQPWTESQIQAEQMREEKEIQAREEAAGVMKESDRARMSKANREAKERSVAELRGIQMEVLRMAHGTRTHRVQEWLAGNRWRLDQTETTPKSETLRHLDRPMPAGIEFETTMIRLGDTNLAASHPDYVDHRHQMASVKGSTWKREALWEAATLEPSVGFLLTMIAGNWINQASTFHEKSRQNDGLDSFAGTTWNTNKLEELIYGKSGRWKVETSETTTNGRTFAVLRLKGRRLSLARGVEVALYVDPADVRKLHRIELSGMPFINTPYISIREEFDRSGFPHLWITETPKDTIIQRKVTISDVAWGLPFDTNTTFRVIVPDSYQVHGSAAR